MLAGLQRNAGRSKRSISARVQTPRRRRRVCDSDASRNRISRRRSDPLSQGRARRRRRGSACQSGGIGLLKAILDTETKTLTWTVSHSGLSGAPIAAHFQGPVSYTGVTLEQNAPIQVDVTANLTSGFKGSDNHYRHPYQGPSRRPLVFQHPYASQPERRNSRTHCSVQLISRLSQTLAKIEGGSIACGMLNIRSVVGKRALHAQGSQRRYERNV